MLTFSQFILESQTNNEHSLSDIKKYSELKDIPNNLKKLLVLYIKNSGYVKEGHRDYITQETLKEKIDSKLFPENINSNIFKLLITKKIPVEDILVDLSTAKGRNQVAKQYIPVVLKVVSGFVGKSRLNRDDLIGAGMEGMNTAIEKWSLEGDSVVSLKTMIGFYARNNILNEINKNGHTLSGTHSGIDKEKYGAGLLDAVSYDGYNVDHMEEIGGTSSEVDLTSTEEKKWDSLFKAIESKFSERNCDIFYRYFGINGREQEKTIDIAKRYGVSNGMIRNTVVNKILKFIKDNQKTMDLVSGLMDLYTESLVYEAYTEGKEIDFLDDTYMYLGGLIQEMNEINLDDYDFLLESGMAGHMSTPIDFDDFTCAELVTLVKNLFNARVSEVKEKLDGMNIQATKTLDGRILFIRNKTDLNNGGFEIDEVLSRWADNNHVKDVYYKACQIITKVFTLIDPKYFNPDPNTRIYANCECILAGRTNIITYERDNVSFHNLFYYKLDEYTKKWDLSEVVEEPSLMNKINTACKVAFDRGEASLTPKVIINVTKESENLCRKYVVMLMKIFNSKINQTIKEYRLGKFQTYMAQKYKVSGDIVKHLFNRIFMNDKSTNLRILKSEFGMFDFDKFLKQEYKKAILFVNKDLDKFVLELGNDVISLCSGFINNDNAANVASIESGLQKIKDLQTKGDLEGKDEWMKNQFDRLGDMTINQTEGIVFNYRGRLMKLTGSFAPINQLLNKVNF